MKFETKLKETEIGKIPEDWAIVRFGDYIEIRHGHQFRHYDFKKNGIKVFKISQIKNDKSIDVSDCSYIDESRIKEFKDIVIEKDDILMALTGATIGKIAKVREDFGIILQNYRVGRFLPLTDKKVSKDFLYYFLCSEAFLRQMFARITQSAQPNIGKEELNNIFFPLPELSEQISIAFILSTLDEKIELNRKMNKTLEKIAQAIFKHWFVDFKFPNENAKPYKSSGGEMVFNGEVGKDIPQGWKIRRLRDLFKFVKGKKPLDISEKHKENYQSQILIETLNGKEPVFANPDGMVFANKKWPIMVMDGASSGRIEIGFKGILGSTLALLKINNEKFGNLVYYFLKDKEGDINQNTTGTAIPHTDKNKVYNYDISLPENDFLIRKFQNETAIIINKIQMNNIQIKSLQRTRDALLPKLMSGEVRVN